MSGECVVSSLLSFLSKNLKWWMDQCYSSVLFRKQKKIHPQSVRVGQAKKQDGGPQLNFDSSFYMFFLLLLLSLPYVNWTSQEGWLFYLRSSLWSSDLPLFYFHQLFPSLSVSHRHFGLLFPILTNRFLKIYIQSTLWIYGLLISGFSQL